MIVRTDMPIHVYVHRCACVCACACMFVYICICVSICVYIYVWICIYVWWSHSDLTQSLVRPRRRLLRPLRIGGNTRSARHRPLRPSPTSDDLCNFGSMVSGDVPRGRFVGPDLVLREVLRGPQGARRQQPPSPRRTSLWPSECPRGIAALCERSPAWEVLHHGPLGAPLAALL